MGESKESAVRKNAERTGARVRYSLIDAVRGIAVVNMVIFHFLYDVFSVYGRDPKWYWRTEIRVWQQGICWTFIFISGFVWRWGREHNGRRGLFLNGCGLLISWITAVWFPSQAIRFGILNFIGCAVWLLYPLHRLTKRIPPAAGAVGSFLLFLAWKEAAPVHWHGEWAFAGEIPGIAYLRPVLTVLGFPYPGFVSADYFPVLPWIFLYLCGHFCGRIFEKHPLWQDAARQKVPVLSAAGKRSIWIYLLHQPVSMLVCMLLLQTGR